MPTDRHKIQSAVLYSNSPAKVIENETADEHQAIARYLHNRLAKEIDPVLKALDKIINRAETTAQTQDSSNGTNGIPAEATCASIAESLGKIAQRIANVESNYSPFISYFGQPISGYDDVKGREENQVSQSLTVQSQPSYSNSRVHGHDQYSQLLDELLLSSTKFINENSFSSANLMDGNSTVFVKSVLDIFSNSDENQHLTPSITVQPDFTEGFINRATHHKSTSEYADDEQQRIMDRISLDDHLRKGFIRDRLIQRDIIEYLVASGRLVSAHQCALQYNFLSEKTSILSRNSAVDNGVLSTEGCGSALIDISPAARKALMPFKDIKVPSNVINYNKSAASIGSIVETPRGTPSVPRRSLYGPSTSGLGSRSIGEHVIKRSPLIQSHIDPNDNKQMTPMFNAQRVSVHSSGGGVKGAAPSTLDLGSCKQQRQTSSPQIVTSLERQRSTSYASDVNVSRSCFTPIRDDGCTGISTEDQQVNFISVLCQGLISALGELESKTKKLCNGLRLPPCTNGNIPINGGIYDETHLFIDSLHDATVLAFTTRQEAAFIYYSDIISNEISPALNHVNGSLKNASDDPVKIEEKRKVLIAVNNTEFIKRVNLLLKADKKKKWHATKGITAQPSPAKSSTPEIDPTQYNTPKKRTRSVLESSSNSSHHSDLRSQSTGSLLAKTNSNEDSLRNITLNSSGYLPEQCGNTPVKWTNGDDNDDIVFHEPIQIFPGAVVRKRSSNAVVSNVTPHHVPATTVCDAIRDLYQRIVSVLLPSIKITDERVESDNKATCYPSNLETGDTDEKDRRNKYNNMIQRLKKDVLGGPEVELLLSLLQVCIFDVSSASVDSRGICKMSDVGGRSNTSAVCDRPRILTRCALSCLYFMDHLAPYLTAPPSEEGTSLAFSEPSFERDRRVSSTAMCTTNIAGVLEKQPMSLREQYGIMLSCLIADAVNCVGDGEGNSTFGNEAMEDDNNIKSSSGGGSENKSPPIQPLHLLLTKKLAQFERDSLLLKRPSNIYCKYTGNCLMGGDSEVKKNDMIERNIHKSDMHSMFGTYPASSNTRGTGSIKLYGHLAYFPDTDVSSQCSVTSDATAPSRTTSIDNIMSLAKLDGLTLEIDGKVIISPDSKSSDCKKTDHQNGNGRSSSRINSQIHSDLFAQSINNIPFNNKKYSSQDKGEALALPNGTVFSKALLSSLLCRYPSPEEENPPNGPRSSGTQFASRGNLGNRGTRTRYNQSSRQIYSERPQEDESTRSLPSSVSGRDENMYSAWVVSEALDRRLRAVRRDLSLPEDYSRHGLISRLGTRGDRNDNGPSAVVRSIILEGHSDNEGDNQQPASVSQEETVPGGHYGDDDDDDDASGHPPESHGTENRQNHSPTTWSNDSGNQCDDEDEPSNTAEDREQTTSANTGVEGELLFPEPRETEESIPPQPVDPEIITTPVVMAVAPPSVDADDAVEEDQEAEVTVYQEFEDSTDDSIEPISIEDQIEDEFTVVERSLERQSSSVSASNVPGASTTIVSNVSTNPSLPDVYMQSTVRYRGIRDTGAISSILLDLLSTAPVSDRRDLLYSTRVGRLGPLTEFGRLFDENPSLEYQSINVEPIMNAVRCPRTGAVFKLSSIKKVYFL